MALGAGGLAGDRGVERAKDAEAATAELRAVGSVVGLQAAMV